MVPISTLSLRLRVSAIPAFGYPPGPAPVSRSSILAGSSAPRGSTRTHVTLKGGAHLFSSQHISVSGVPWDMN